ncbi:MAG: adenylate/guanylate cyclase [Chitinophagaceae bacterium]|jgi:adenylate cyclase|nr:adenylate/guanylate cyclase [Chitinophagaceae bacterium]
MTRRRRILPQVSNARKFKLHLVFSIAAIWTLVDLINFFTSLPSSRGHSLVYNLIDDSLLLRQALVFFLSAIVAYLLVFVLKRVFRNYSMWFALLTKSFILIAAAVFISFLIHVSYSLGTGNADLEHALGNFWYDALNTYWLFQKVMYWLALLLITQIIIEVHDKYSPGVFFDLLLGKYLRPKVEQRIVMFIDLKDSTPIAEKLGTIPYFKFIREFIYQISSALIEHDGIIYQYVGDEIVVSWRFNEQNTRKCMDSLIEARKNLQLRGEHFRRRYGITPEFRVGIHAGEVTVGEIGVIKKDLAMSGDTMNTTARIRTACSELNQKFVVSRAFIDHIDLKEWQSESLGQVDLKGKNNSIELFALRI